MPQFTSKLQRIKFIKLANYSFYTKKRDLKRISPYHDNCKQTQYSSTTREISLHFFSSFDQCLFVVPITNDCEKKNCLEKKKREFMQNIIMLKFVINVPNVKALKT